MKKTPIIIIAALVVVVALVSVVAASSGKKNPSTGSANNDNSSKTSTMNNAPTASTAVAADKVDINNYMFGPGDIKIKVGTIVTWTNHDSVRHNIVSDDNMMPDGKLIAKDETYTYTFTKAGTYKYHCAPHQYMHGSVVVE